MSHSHMACLGRSEKSSYNRYGWDSMWLGSDSENVWERQRCIATIQLNSPALQENFLACFGFWLCHVNEFVWWGSTYIHSLLSLSPLHFFLVFLLSLHVTLSWSLFFPQPQKSLQTLFFFFFSLYNTGMQPPKFPPPRLSAVLKNAKPTSFFQAYLHFPYILLSLIPWFLSLSLCT